MLGCRGKVQREGEVTHVIAEHLVDLSGDLRRVSELDRPFRWPAGRGDGARQMGGPDPRERQGLRRKPRDIYVPDLRIETLKVGAGFPVSFLVGGAAETFPQISCSWKSDMPPDQPHPSARCLRREP